MNVRGIIPEDAAAVAGIYNYYIARTHHTFETEPVSADEMARRIAAVISAYPFLVCEDDGSIIGYAYAARYKPRQGYLYSVETSVYVNKDSHHRGAGRSLCERLFEELKKTDTHAIIAGIALPNEASIRLHENLGMKKVAHFQEVGYKLGRWIDVGYWELVMRELGTDHSPQTL